MLYVEHILQTPFFLQALSAVIMTSMFIGSLIYNGDLKLIYKAIVGIGGYAFFVGLINYFHLSQLENYELSRWIQPIWILLFVLVAYVIGLFIGVLIHWYIHKK